MKNKKQMSFSDYPTEECIKNLFDYKKNANCYIGNIPLNSNYKFPSEIKENHEEYEKKLIKTSQKTNIISIKKNILKENQLTEIIFKKQYLTIKVILY